MAANEKAPITVALQNGGTPHSLHHDLAGHFRMDRAVVGIRSCLGKGVRELLVRVHHPRLEYPVCAHSCMRNVITVYPGDCCSDGYRNRLRPKTKLSILIATFAAEG
jgi:hypothetical protein